MAKRAFKKLFGFARRYVSVLVQRPKTACIAALCSLALLGPLQIAYSQERSPTANRTTTLETPKSLESAPGSNTDPKQLMEKWAGRDGLSSALQIMLLLTVISVAPALLLMTTSFIRIVVVLGLLRQALGTQQLPPSQVITSIALFVTLLIMTPVWKQVYDEAIAPYTEEGSEMELSEAWDRGQAPIRRFMSDQIVRTGNAEDVYLFLDYLDPPTDDEETESARPTYVYFNADPEQGEADVPLRALLPAFMLSELKTAFVIGFQIYLPFVILDLVISSVLISMGMMMLPPVLISLPFKLLLFVLVDGWRLVVEMLLLSFEPYF